MDTRRPKINRDAYSITNTGGDAISDGAHGPASIASAAGKTGIS
jgi:hypothetical protein